MIWDNNIQKNIKRSDFDFQLLTRGGSINKKLREFEKLQKTDCTSDLRINWLSREAVRYWLSSSFSLLSCTNKNGKVNALIWFVLLPGSQAPLKTDIAVSLTGLGKY